MFMDEEKNERYLQALEHRNKIEFAKHQTSTRRFTLAVLLTPVAAAVWGIPLAVILWRAAVGS
jgi:hypothetical protein